MSAETLTPLFSREAIAARVAELGQEISAVYGDEPLLAVCVLKGAVFFFADLVRGISCPNMELGFLRLSSYGTASAPGQLKFGGSLGLDVAGRHALLVEDVVDTGHSMRFLLEEMRRLGPLSVRLAALVDKHERREAEVRVDFAGFQLGSGFIVGYGLDYAERYRQLPDIRVLHLGQD